MAPPWTRQPFPPPEDAEREARPGPLDWMEPTRARLRAEHAPGMAERAPPSMERWAEARRTTEEIAREIREVSPDSTLAPDASGLDPRRVAEFKRIRFNAACKPAAIDPEKKTIYVCGRPVQAGSFRTCFLGFGVRSQDIISGEALALLWV